MKALATLLLKAVASAAVLGLVPAALAHGDDMNMEMGEADRPLPQDQYPPTYFAHPDHRAAIYTHIGLMTLAWVFVLPAAVMLSLARSRYTLVTQFAFTVVNALGVVVGTIYNASTPDLYPNNAHHKLGWIVTSVVGTQVAIGMLARVAGMLSRRRGHSHEHQYFIPISMEAMAEHDSRFEEDCRVSNDSGQGTEPHTESLRSQSLSSSADSPSIPMRYIPLRDVPKAYEENQDEESDLDAQLSILSRFPKARVAMQKAGDMVSSRFWQVFVFAYNFVDRTILILGFITFCTGIITFGRFFEGHGIFSGLAHWIKGGIFFWMGILTLGRWSGCFGDLGWAWNIPPKQARPQWRPSAEFVESALVFTYGATNIFLEHLGNWGGEWSAQDLEHMSITVLFIGGGLFGMLVESVRVRDLLNVTVSDAVKSVPDHAYRDEERDGLRQPETYTFSMNPTPALVILLLGIMMSSHTQESMVSSMVHKQWGQLLTGASFARGFSYVLTYLRPPRSVYPSRPPTEILAAFGLISGGIIFMASASDTVSGMIHYGLDAMFMYTITMGLVGLLMAWVIILVALKGWAVRRERRRNAMALG